MMIRSGCSWLKRAPACCDLRLIIQSKYSLYHSSTVWQSDNTYYDILGVDQTASKRDVRSAFLTLSKKHHPDINKKQDANNHFMAISEAYNTLYNPAKRYHYDLHLRSTKSHHLSDTLNSDSSSAYEHAGNYRNISEEEWAKMYQASVRPKRDHTPLILVLIAIMVTGSVVHSMRIQATHKQYQEMADEETRKNIQQYKRVRERAAQSSVSEQLDRLSQLHAQNKEQ